jgi:hypothetical protein
MKRKNFKFSAYRIFLEGIMGLKIFQDYPQNSQHRIGSQEKSGSKWVLLLILIVLASGAVWYFEQTRSC